MLKVASHFALFRVDFQGGRNRGKGSEMSLLKCVSLQ